LGLGAIKELGTSFLSIANFKRARALKVKFYNFARFFKPLVFGTLCANTALLWHATCLAWAEALRLITSFALVGGGFAFPFLSAFRRKRQPKEIHANLLARALFPTIIWGYFSYPDRSFTPFWHFPQSALQGK